jgi:hypothetical protein
MKRKIKKREIHLMVSCTYLELYFCEVDVRSSKIEYAIFS